MKKKILSVLFALVLVASLGLVTAVPVAANGTPDHYVSLTGSNVSPYETLANAANKIQDAIGVAVTGDKVHVAVGTYNEDITLKNEVQVLGAGEASTTINGTGTGSVVTASGVGPTTKLDGFTVTGGDTNTTGGGGMYIVNSSLTVSNCTFDSNTASGTGIPSGVGGGMHNLNSSPTITNCTFSGNTAGQPGAGMCNNNSSPTITNCTFFGNETTFGGGGMYNRNGGTPTVTDCTFYNNTGSYGAGMYNYDSPATVTNCTFYSNAGQDGGGMYDSNSSSEVTNCIFYGNRASGRGGGMFIRDSSPTVTNCTFSGNSAYYYGGAIFSQHLSTATVTNCILWGDSVQVHEGPEIYDYVDPTFPSVTTVNYSDVQGGWPGTGNIEAYPYFSNPFAGDYHLESDSPCINAGSNAAVPVWLTTDFEGDDRIIGAAVDMGADEFLPHEVWVVITGSDTNPGTWSLPFATIQMGIDTVAEGGTVNVAAGIYDEQVVINKALTLQGTGDTTGIQPSGPELIPTTSIPWINAGTGTMSAIVSVETTGDEVTIRDLEIDGSLITSKSTTWVAGLVYLETSGKIEGVTVNGGSTLPDRTAGIFAAAIGEPAILEVTGCTVEVYTRAGIYALGGQLTADYHHNEINGPGSISTGVPNGMFFLEGVNGSATYNTVTDLGYTGGGEYRSTGIGTYNAGTDVTFAYNTISYVQNAFALSTGTIGTIVEYNDIYNCHTGVRIEAAAASSVIQYNDIHDNDFAMRCGANMGDGNVAHYNNFVNNPGLEWTNEAEAEPNTYVGAVCNVHPTFILDAQNNWWGDATGPGGVGAGAGDAISDNVDYSPWCTNPDYTEISHIQVDDDGVNVFNTIQDAIDAANDGDTVNVAAGTYDEYVNITESLTLSGQPGAIVKPSSAVDAPIIGINADGVTVEGFEVDGMGLTPEVWAGIGSWTGCTNVTIKNNTIHDIANSVDSGLGIGLWRGDETIYEDILIEGNTVYNTDRMGIYIGAWDDPDWLLSDNITIRDNEVYNTMLKSNVNETFPGGCGGIAIDAAKNCTIEGNTVYDTANTMPGIFLAHGSGPGNQILGNEVYNQAYGIAVDINRGDVDFDTDSPTPPEVHFNNIHDNSEYGLIVLNADGKVVVATNNWWGDASGPYHTTNLEGLGNAVSDDVTFIPWFEAGVEDSKSEDTTDDPEVTVDATTEADTVVIKTGSGTPTITVTEYTGNPGGATPGGFSSAGKYIDVHIDDTTDVTEIEIRNYYTLEDIAGLNEATLKLSWWDGTAWIECFDSGATYPAGAPTYRGYVWAKIRATGTTPTLDELAGTPFMPMGKLPPPPPPAGGGFVPPAPTVTTNLFGAVGIFSISGTGEIQEAITATSVDGNLTMTIPAGTIALDKDGNPLISLTAAVDPSPPPPPEGAHIIGLAYKFEPAGATFDPPLTLEYTYDPADIPEGVAEGDLVLAFYIEGIPPEPGEWVELPCVVDPVTHRIIATVSHFTTFAIIAHIPPPAPAAFSLSNLTVQPAEVQPKEAVTIAASVANTGGTEGSYAVVLKINGVKEVEKIVTIAAGGSQTVTFSVTKEDAASYSVTVDGLSGSFTVVPPPPPPAAFSVSSLTVQPAEVQPGEAVTIEVALTNTGGTHGNYTVVLKINGVKVADRTVTIDAGDTLNIIFPVTKEAAGSYTVTVDGLSGSFTVVAPVTNWPLIGGIIGAIIVIGLLIFLLNYIRRRRA